MGAAVLAAFASCERETNPTNGNYNPDTDEVKTAFVMNISTAATTKQTSATVQASSSESFRGIQDAWLMSIIQTSNGKLLAADCDADKVYDMSDAVYEGTITDDNSRRVFEMSLPLKTNTILFYGRAPKGSAADGLSAKDIYGHLDSYTIGKTKGSELFQLGKRLSNSTEWTNKVEQFKAIQGLFVGIYTCTMNTHLNQTLGTHDSFTIGNYTLDGTSTDLAAGGYPNVRWKDYAALSGKSPVETTHERYELENKLGKVYTQMTDIKSAAGEIRASSGEALLRTMQDLWTIINEVKCATPFSAAEAVAVRLAQKIDARLATYFSATVPADGGPVTDIAFKPTNDVITAVSNDIKGVGTIGSFWPAEGVSKKPSDATLASMPALIGSLNPKNFPQYFDIPRGAAYINFDDEKLIFYFPSSFNTTGMGGIAEGGGFNAESYYYPAELLYFGNSPIRATDTEFRTVQYPGGNNAENAYNGAWTSPSSWTAWGSGNFVKSSTRSVAMVNEVNYGVALLETKVKFGASTLYDNNHAIQVARDTNGNLTDGDEPDQEIAVTASTFQLTGVIIGGVHQNVGWDYLPVKVDVGGVMTDVEGFVYDKAIASKAIPASGTSQPNYTMVFDNFKGTYNETTGIWTAASTQDKVYVALEFLNNSGKDFYGNHNLIRNGGYFYLIGELDPGKAGLADGIVWADQGASDPMVHRIPPYNADGTSQQTARVFIQDYLTKATFTIGANSLKKAYLTTPDLRSNSMTFGLSVDLEWSTGIDFGDVVLGEN